jgi:lysozyme
MKLIEEFADHLEWAEARKPYPYRCSAGKLTIGVGRNLDDKGLSDDEINYLLANDMRDTIADASRLDYWNELDDVRQLVVADMIFNLGMQRFMWFKKLNAALAIHDYTLAAHEMKDSKWYRQVGRRSEKLREAMITGVWK